MADAVLSRVPAVTEAHLPILLHSESTNHLSVVEVAIHELFFEARAFHGQFVLPTHIDQIFDNEQVFIVFWEVGYRHVEIQRLLPEHHFFLVFGDLVFGFGFAEGLEGVSSDEAEVLLVFDPVLQDVFVFDGGRLLVDSFQEI